MVTATRRSGLLLVLAIASLHKGHLILILVVVIVVVPLVLRLHKLRLLLLVVKWLLGTLLMAIDAATSLRRRYAANLQLSTKVMDTVQLIVILVVVGIVIVVVVRGIAVAVAIPIPLRRQRGRGHGIDAGSLQRNGETGTALDERVLRGDAQRQDAVLQRRTGAGQQGGRRAGLLLGH